MDTITEHADELAIRASWVVPAPRPAVYAIVSDFERLAVHFPRLAHSARITARDGNRLVVEVRAASFGRLFPGARITIHAELQPGCGYRCETVNHTFGTTGREALELGDDPGGTRIAYTYRVRVRPGWLRPLYAWLVRRLALPYWKRNYLDPLARLALQRGHEGTPRA